MSSSLSKLQNIKRTIKNSYLTEDIIILPSKSVKWLTDNGSAYRVHETRRFVKQAGLSPRHTVVRGLQSNGIAESFVKIMKRDYISLMSKPNGLTAVKNLAEALEHYNEWHPHSALGYRSLRDVDSYK